MTASGEKMEEYREITPYWISRLCEKHHPSVIAGGDLVRIHSGIQFSFKKFDTNTITLGYPRRGDAQRVIVLKHAGIQIRAGRPELGAEPGKNYFVILHGERVG